MKFRSTGLGVVLFSLAMVLGCGDSNEPCAVTGAILSPSQQTVKPGASVKFTASVNTSQSDGCDKTVAWTTRDTAIATVDQLGNVTGVKAGTTSVEAVSAVNENVKAVATVIVEDWTVTGVTVTPNAASIESGSSTNLRADVAGDSGVPQDVTWISADPAKVQVTSTGANTATVTGVQEGTAPVAVTATSTIDMTKSGSSQITITAAPGVNSVSVDPATFSMKKGETKVFRGIVTKTGDVSTDVTWSLESSVPAGVASITVLDGDEARVTALAAGTVDVVASAAADAAKKGRAELTVTDVVITAVDVNPKQTEIFVGKTQQFTATVTTDPPGDPIDKTVKWSVDKPAIASIDPDTGLLTGLAAGPGVVVTATTVVQSVTGTTTLTVKQVEVAGIVVAPANPTIKVGDQQQFTATVTTNPPDGQLDRTVMWSSDKPNVVSIDPTTGLASGLTEGSVVITATSVPRPQAAPGTTTLKVDPFVQASITSVTLTAGNAAGNAGSFSVKVNADDGEDTITKMDLLVAGEVVQTQSFKPGPQRIAREHTFTYDSSERDLTKPGNVRFKNGIRTITARITTARSQTKQSDLAGGINFQNTDTFTGVITASGDSAQDAAGSNLKWRSGNVTVSGRAFVYTNNTISTVDIEFAGPAPAGFRNFGVLVAGGQFTTTFNLANFQTGQGQENLAQVISSTYTGGGNGPFMGPNEFFFSPDGDGVRMDNVPPAVPLQANLGPQTAARWVGASHNFLLLGYVSGGDAGVGVQRIESWAGEGTLANVNLGGQLAPSPIGTPFIYNLEFREFDRLGNQRTTSFAQTFGVDIGNPVLSFTGASLPDLSVFTALPGGNWVVDATDDASGPQATVNLGLKRVDASGVTCILGSGLDCSPTSTGQPKTLAFDNGVNIDGYYTYRATINDIAGNLSNELVCRAALDRTPPNVISVSQIGVWNGGETVQLSSSVQDNVEIINLLGFLSYPSAPASAFFTFLGGQRPVGTPFDDQTVSVDNDPVFINNFIRSIQATDGTGAPTGGGLTGAKPNTAYLVAYDMTSCANCDFTTQTKGWNGTLLAGANIQNGTLITGNEAQKIVVGPSSAGQVCMTGSDSVTLQADITVANGQSTPFTSVHFFVLGSFGAPLGTLPVWVEVGSVSAPSSQTVTGTTVLHYTFDGFKPDSRFAAGDASLIVIGVTAAGDGLMSPLNTTALDICN